MKGINKHFTYPLGTCPKCGVYDRILKIGMCPICYHRMNANKKRDRIVKERRQNEQNY